MAADSAVAAETERRAAVEVTLDSLQRGRDLESRSYAAGAAQLRAVLAVKCGPCSAPRIHRHSDTQRDAIRKYHGPERQRVRANWGEDHAGDSRVNDWAGCRE